MILNNSIVAFNGNDKDVPDTKNLKVFFIDIKKVNALDGDKDDEEAIKISFVDEGFSLVVDLYNKQSKKRGFY